MPCAALEYLCGARGGGANYPAAPGAAAVVVATKLRMTNELSAGGSWCGRRGSPGEWGGAGGGGGRGEGHSVRRASLLVCSTFRLTTYCGWRDIQLQQWLTTNTRERLEVKKKKKKKIHLTKKSFATVSYQSAAARKLSHNSWHAHFMHNCLFKWIKKKTGKKFQDELFRLSSKIDRSIRSTECRRRRSYRHRQN